MESVSSTSPPPEPDHSPPNTRVNLTRSVANRIIRALYHRLLMLHRPESDFYVLGATDNVYTVTLAPIPSCMCPDRISSCKHILFVLIRILGLFLDDTCLRRSSLRCCQLSRLISTPTFPESLARASIRETFHRMFIQSRQSSNARGMTVETANMATCPICLKQMRHAQKVVAYGTCRNAIHEEKYSKESDHVCDLSSEVEKHARSRDVL